MGDRNGLPPKCVLDTLHAAPPSRVTDTNISYITTDISIEIKLLYRRSLRSITEENLDRQYIIP